MEKLDDYEDAALRTMASHNDLGCAGLGLAGEAGEFADLVKKHVYHHHPLDREKAIKELGDVLWYLALGARLLNVRLSEVARVNVEKLRARYPQGFTVADSLKHVPRAPPPDGVTWSQARPLQLPTAVRVFGAAGLVASVATLCAGVFSVTVGLSVAGGAMLLANLYALVRGR